MARSFAEDVRQGLASSPKYLPSKYFYDQKGDVLFQQIMEMQEYYLTDAELDVFRRHAHELLELFNGSPFRLIEFGAGDGFKTRVLFEHFLDRGADFWYRPIDISGNVLDTLCTDMRERFPDLHIDPIENDYFLALQQLNYEDTSKKVIIFLGSNIGNFSDNDAISFLKHIREFMNPGDLLMIGMDLKKDPDMILNAYNDKNGITRDFNLNLLNRINTELGGHFDLDTFRHYPTYDPKSGIAASYLISEVSQTVEIDQLNSGFYFRQWEPIHMEISRKYDLHDIEGLAASSGFDIVANMFDKDHHFVDTVWSVRSEPAFGS